MENIDDNQDLPKLNIEEENEFKKLKLNIEYGMDFGKNANPNIPAEIEGHFLDYISNFEKAYKDAKQISVYEKLGKPTFRPSSELNDEEVKSELEAVFQLMNSHSLELSVLCHYENEDRLIYDFLVNQLFLEEIDDMYVPGMITNFIYEEFHPNHKYDLERDTSDFLNMFLNKKSTFYDEYHSKDALNHIELNNFRDLFRKFKMTSLEITDVNFDEEDATVNFKIDFWGKAEGSDYKTAFSGNGSMTFKKQYGYWYVKMVELPF